MRAKVLECQKFYFLMAKSLKNLAVKPND